MRNQTPTIVMDCGSFMMKAGFADNDEPTTIFEPIVGRLRPRNFRMIPHDPDILISEDAIKNKTQYTLTNPMEMGYISNWDDLERIWHYTFYNKLNIEPEQHSILLTEPALNPQLNRHKMTEIMFETYSVQSFCLKMQPVLSLFASGKQNGMVIDYGHQQSNIVPIYEGYAVKNKIFRQPPLSGHDITCYLQKLLKQKGYSINTSIVSDIKEKLCYIALDYNKELNKNKLLLSKIYKLADGNIVNIDLERFQCAEYLFNPKLNGNECLGVHWILYNDIMKCDESMREMLFNNIVLCGGNMMFKGIINRLTKELQQLTDYRINVYNHSHFIGEQDKIVIDGYLRNNKYLNVTVNRDVSDIIYKHYSVQIKYLSWIGGSILAATSSFSDLSITMDQYDEYGPFLVDKY